MPHISVIMPAFNEGDHIYENIALTRQTLTVGGLDAEIVVVDDGSTDNTRAEIERAAHTFPAVVACANPYNMGKGRALRTGFASSDGEIVVFLDADMDLHPDQVGNLVSELERGGWDVVVTSKHHPDSKLAYPAMRTIMSWGYYLFIKLLFGLPVRDTQTGLKVFRRNVLDMVFHRLLVKKFAYDVELLATAVRFGYRVTEVPVVLNFRRDLTWGRIGISDIMYIVVDTLAVFYRLRIMKYYDIERPPPLRNVPKTLVMLRGTGAVTEATSRLIGEPACTVGCITDNPGVLPTGVLPFRSEAEISAWLNQEGTDIELVGFIGNDCLPEGNWTANAARAFSEPGVNAVCGPVAPTPGDDFGETVAGYLASSRLTSGPSHYLHSPRPMRTVRAGSHDNIVLRAEAVKRGFRERLGLSSDSLRMYDITPANARLRYDPDLVVTAPVPPVFQAYFSRVARDTFRRGRGAEPLRLREDRLWELTPLTVLLILGMGWIWLPWHWFAGVVAVFGATVVGAGILTADPWAAPLVTLGLIIEYGIRAIIYPAGLIARLGGPARH